jgi:HlyD family secretion protein
MKKWIKWIVWIVLLSGIATGGYLGYQRYSGKTEHVVYRTEKAIRENMSSFISATGTVEPEELVNVGAQVNGMIEKFGLDADGKTVDYGSRVTAGMVLAQIDDSLFVADLRQNEAQKLQAKASLISASAAISQAKARLGLAETNYTRAKQLQPKGAMSQSDYDAAFSEYTVAQAAIAVAEADLEQAKAQLANAEASRDRSARNLSYCTIKSPVDGIIIDRRVSVGQTVNSSMNAPSLFLIAKDLRKMQVWVSVNEADVGEIKQGMPVTFTVDAFPNREFKGSVHKIRFNATMSQNVVTYVVEVGTDNSDGTLLPYLTANVKFIMASRENALRVPNSAFRYTPDATLLPPDTVVPENKRGERTLWVLDDNMLKPVKVVTGLNDGVSTEIVSGGLEEGMEVVTGTSIATIAAQPSAGGGAGSPFLPKPPQRPGTRANAKQGGQK